MKAFQKGVYISLNNKQLRKKSYFQIQRATEKKSSHAVSELLLKRDCQQVLFLNQIIV